MKHKVEFHIQREVWRSDPLNHTYALEPDAPKQLAIALGKYIPCSWVSNMNGMFKEIYDDSLVDLFSPIAFLKMLQKDNNGQN